MPQTCDSPFLAPRSAIRKRGVQLRNPETQAIRANLRIDSRESGHLSSKRQNTANWLSVWIAKYSHGSKRLQFPARWCFLYARVLCEGLCMPFARIGAWCSVQRNREPVSLNGCLGFTERGGWKEVGRKGWQRVAETLAKGWQRVGGFPCTLQFRNSRGAHLETRVCDSMVHEMCKSLHANRPCKMR